MTALVLFAIGFYKARVTVGKPLRSGTEMMLIGMISAMVGYLVGVLLKVPPLP
ncbi:MAG: VIT1/CCC1 transporter family protein [Chloroflexi bacterium]|nr:VIT1/CCC1 transporter family protein [Chloroflexota bacterium]